MEKDHRLFLKHLPPNVTDEQIAEKFQDYGAVGKIEIKEKVDGFGNLNKFAFVHVTTSERTLNKCFQDLRDLTINGSRIELQVAKESFLARLQRERESGNAESSKSNETSQHFDFSAPAVRDIKPIIVKPPEPSRRSYTIASESDGVEKKPRKSLAVTATEKKLVIQEVLKQNSPLIDKTIEGTNKITPSLKEVTKQQSESEAKRLKSLQEKKKAFRVQGSLIREALNAVDRKPLGKKIVFDDDISEVVQNGQEERITKRLFDEDDEDETEVADFKIRDNDADKKLMSLQSKYSNDKRFKLDERFLDDEDNEDETPVEPLSGPQEERNWQLDILQDVLGMPLKTSVNDNATLKRKSAMVRYDPSQESHHVAPVAPAPKSNSKKNAKRTEEATAKDESPEENPIPMSKETYFDVSENLADSLKPIEGFSLLKSFGREMPTRDQPEMNGEVRDKIPLPFNLDVSNPFKYDSSDNESVHGDDILEAPKNDIRSDWNDRLFFSINDARFQDAENFFKEGSALGHEFTSLRRTLKQIVRSKIQNNLRKKVTWKRRKPHK